MALRIYVVSTNGVERLIEAGSKSSALGYAVKTTMTVELAGQSDLVRLLNEKIAVESVQIEGV